MEPDDQPPPDLPIHDLLSVGEDAEAGPDPLRAIVARARRRRWRVAAGGMALALVAGGALGYAVSNHSSHSSTAAETATASAPPATGSGSGSGSASGSGSPAGSTENVGTPVTPGQGGLFRVGVIGPLTRMFIRTTGGGVTLRVFRTAPVPPAGLPASCMVTVPQLQVEVSTAAMVGVTVGAAPAAHSQPVTAVESQAVGQAEGDPAAVIMVATGPTVKQVRVSFKGGATDSMAPVGGWAVLAGSVPAHLNPGAAIGTLTATDASGRVVSSSSLTLNEFQPLGAPAASCRIMCPTAGAGAGAGSRAPSPLPLCTSVRCGPPVPVPGGAPAVTVPAPARPPALPSGRTFTCATGGSRSSAGGAVGTGSSGNR